MVTIISNGKAHTLASDSVLMQLPTPLLCISRTPRSPPSQAPAKMPMPSSSVVSTVGFISLAAWHNSISRACPESGTYVTWRTSNARNFSKIRLGQFCASAMTVALSSLLARPCLRLCVAIGVLSNRQPLPDGFVGHHVRRRPLLYDPPLLHHVTGTANSSRTADVLLHEQQRDAFAA